MPGVISNTQRKARGEDQRKAIKYELAADGYYDHTKDSIDDWKNLKIPKKRGSPHREAQLH